MRKITLFCIILTLAGCVHIPKETVLLSNEMGGMISANREATMKLIDQLHASRVERVDEYFQSTLIPKFVQNMARDNDLEKVVCKKGYSLESMDELAGFSLAAAKKIAAERKKFTDAIDSKMAELRTAAAQSYDTLALSNRAVTDNIRSVLDNKEVLEDSMKRFKLEPEKLLPAKLRELDDKLDKMLN